MSRRFVAPDWSYSASLYEVNLRQYTPEGSFKAFSDHLPRLADMGIAVLWFMPITPISKEQRQGSLGSYYACSDYKSTNPEFGTIADFTALVKQAHELGLKVIIDWVANHTGWDHVWTKTNPGFYKKNSEGEFYEINGWKDVIDLNYYDHGMRRAMVDAMSFWVKECDVDGFRCDMAHLVPRDFWRDARTELDVIKPLLWLGEMEDMNYMDVFDCCYTWEWMHQTEKYCRCEADLTSLEALLGRYKVNFPKGTFPLFFTSNHDENSWNGTEYEKYDGAAKPLAVFACTWHGAPLLYSGQELPNKKRLKFFDRDTIEWTGKYELHEFYKALLQLRRHHPAMRADGSSGPQLISTRADDQVLCFLRKNKEKEVLVVLNLSAARAHVQLPEGTVQGTFTDVFTGTKVAIGSGYAFELAAWGCRVLWGE